MPDPSAHPPRPVPQVMVSSTFTDLKEHRAALIEAINAHGMHPRVMEHDGAKLADVIDSSLGMVRDSAAYILVISHKYGQTPEDATRNPNQLSITELEFDEAVQLGRPALLFVMGDQHPVTRNDVEKDSAKEARLEAFRARAKKIAPGSSVHRIYAAFNNLEEFKAKMNPSLAELKEHLSKLEEDRAKGMPASPAASPSTATAATSVPHTTIPHNLPTLQPFFGREGELAQIADALKPESRTWGALIDGPGGMGKTSLAVRAAYDAPTDAFEKIVFVSLKTRELDDDGVRDLSGFILSGLAELFGELARELGRDDIAKATEDQRPRLLLEALRGKRVLLILDNLESLVKKDRDTVFTFVKKLPQG